jgi:hypothetical protein
MISVENFKSTQLRKLFKIYRSSFMQSWPNWSAGRRLFQFTNVSSFWKSIKFPNQEGPPVSARCLDRDRTVANGSRRRPSYLPPTTRVQPYLCVDKTEENPLPFSPPCSSFLLHATAPKMGLAHHQVTLATTTAHLVAGCHRHRHHRFPASPVSAFMGWKAKWAKRP